MDSEPTYVVYKHLNVLTSKAYIGVTKDIGMRTAHHKIPSSRCTRLRNSIQKHGWEVFETTVIERGLTLEQALEAECKYIAEHNTLDPHGYNLTSGGEHPVMSPATRQRMSEAKLGVQRSEEVRQAIRKGLTGKPKSPEHVKAMSESRKGKPTKNKGRPASRLVCPYCHCDVARPTFNRYHGERCAVRVDRSG